MRTITKIHNGTIERWILLAYASRSLSVSDGVLLLTLRNATVFGGDEEEDEEVDDILWILLRISCWWRTCCCCCWKWWWWWWLYLAAAAATCLYFKCFGVCTNITLSIDSVELFLVDDCVFVDGTRSVSCCCWSSMSGTIWTSNNSDEQYLYKGEKFEWLALKTWKSFITSVMGIFQFRLISVGFANAYPTFIITSQILLFSFRQSTQFCHLWYLYINSHKKTAYFANK